MQHNEIKVQHNEIIVQHNEIKVAQILYLNLFLSTSFMMLSQSFSVNEFQEGILIFYVQAQKPNIPPMAAAGLLDPDLVFLFFQIFSNFSKILQIF